MVRKLRKQVTARHQRIQAIMKKFEDGELRSLTGEIVRNRRKALAIAMDEVGLRRDKKRKRRKQ